VKIQAHAAKLTSEQAELDATVEELRWVADETGLSEPLQRGINKAQRVLPQSPFCRRS